MQTGQKKTFSVHPFLAAQGLVRGMSPSYYIRSSRRGNKKVFRKTVTWVRFILLCAFLIVSSVLPVTAPESSNGWGFSSLLNTQERKLVFTLREPGL